MDAKELTAMIKREAHELGFSLAAVCSAVAPPGADRLDDWLAEGYAGEMAYLADRREAYAHPNRLLDGAKSVVMFTLDYLTEEPAEIVKGAGRVSRYAWGDADYHDLIRPKLHHLADKLREAVPEAMTRGVVDTAPLMERDFAQLAGLGWIGKNTLLLNRDRGSWFFLAALLTDIELEVDEPMATDHCGTCTACLDACPTDAFVEAGVLNGSKCISYLTIEQKGMPELSLREGIGNWLFGCDVCQEVCPWNSRAQQATEPAFQPREAMNPADLVELLSLDDEGFRKRFRGTPLWRPKRRGILRNAAIVLGNQRPEGADAILAKALQDEEPLVRCASAWALGRYGTELAKKSLQQRSEVETETEVLAEIRRELAAF